MDAVEFEKARFRMCRANLLKHGYCELCDAYNFETRRCGFVPRSLGSRVDDEDVIKKNIAIVEKWKKDNPVKTRQSEFLKMFPDAKIDDDGILSFCPDAFSPKEIDDEHCHKYNKCEECRKDYWLVEVTDND